MRTSLLITLVGLGTSLSCTGREKRTAPQRAAAGDHATTSIAAPASGTLDAAPDAPLAQALPDRAGPFTAGPLTTDAQFVRRSYQRGATQISVTIAVPGATPLQYEEWVRMSAGSPQVDLRLPADSGAGFYDCAGKHMQGICNVHIQLRAGHHIEMMGERAAYRADFDALLAGLPLRELTR